MPTSTPMIPIKGAKEKKKDIKDAVVTTGVKYFYDVYIKLTGNSVLSIHYLYTNTSVSLLQTELANNPKRMYLRSAATNYESITDFLL